MTIKKLFAYLIVIESCFGTFISSNAESLYVKSSSGETYECPPLPPVFVDGVLTSWVDAYGSLPFLLLPDGSLLGSDSKNPPRSGEPPVPPGVVTPASDTNTVNFQINWEQIRYNINTNLSGSILTNNPPLDIDIANRTIRQFFLDESYPPKVDILDLENKARKRKETLENNPELIIPINLDLHLVGKETYLWGTCYILWLEGLPNRNIPDLPDEQDVEFFATTDLASGDWKLVNFNKTARTISNNIKEYIVYLNDDPESIYFTVFPLRDTDEDYLSDGVEKLIFKSNPGNCDSDFLRDSNSNGIPDYPNKANNWICDGDEDLDGDGVSNADELARGTNPFVAETNIFEDPVDFFPLWAKKLIYIYTGEYTFQLLGDSDSDGVNDYTEIALGTDPSKADFYYSEQASYSYFSTNQNRVFTLPSFVVRDVSTNNLFSNGLYFDVYGILGSYLHAEVKKNAQMKDGFLCDQINIRGAYIIPDNWTIFNLVSTNNISILREGLSSSVDLLGTMASLTESIFEEPGVSTALEDISADAAYIISNRSLGRISILMKQMQSLAPYLMEDFQDQSPAMQRKICKWVSNILSEANLYNRSVNRYSYPTGAFPILNHVNRIASGTSIFCTYLSIANSPYTQDLQNSVIAYFNQINYPDEEFDGAVWALAYYLTYYINNIEPSYTLAIFDEIWAILQSFGTY